MSYLIVGLGNIGSRYHNTRHNIGFDVVDKLAYEFDAEFDMDRLAFVAEAKFKGRKLYLIKPTTYMNLSGRAVRYWMQSTKVPLERTLIVVDDLALDFGKIRLKGKGNAGGHNGLKSLQAELGTSNYSRLRFGIGDNYRKGQQVDYVLGEWTKSEEEELPTFIANAAEAVKSFASIGLERTMNTFNTNNNQ